MSDIFRAKAIDRVDCFFGRPPGSHCSGNKARFGLQLKRKIQPFKGFLRGDDVFFV
ncbi:hypothetical protein [Rhizobium grahamii]|uniref:hypothetical protein n=1 Tax=Rhizobium grahamii TaxID=1120045 RepID=UPI001678652E